MAPAFAALGLGGMLLVSLRVRGMQEATQLGGLFVLPVIALVVGEVRGAVLLGPWMAVAIGLLVWAIAGVLLAIGIKGFRRTTLVGKL
jgi:ABC-2 type transport system permease protein